MRPNRRGSKSHGGAEPATGRAPSPLGLVAAVAIPAAITAIALFVPRQSPATAAALYLLGVVTVSVGGGLWAGLVASVLSFFGLNFFFTTPEHTLAVRRPQDLVSLVVFLTVATVVGILVTRLLEARHRAERRAAEMARLQAFTSLLLSDRPLEPLLFDAAASLADSFQLIRCSIEVDGGEGAGPVNVVAGPDPAGDDHAAVVPIELGVRRLGELVAVRPAALPLTDDDERLLSAFAGQLALATDRARNEADARTARLDAEASKARAALFSSVTHDLRTPLSSIKASVTALIDSADALGPVQRHDLMRTILEEADRLNRLVGNLLDLARVRAGALTPALERSGVEDVVEAVVARLRPLLAPFSVRLQIRPNLPEAWIDPVQIDQVLTNVLENAARFSTPGSEIRVAVAAFQDAIEVTVADRGPGIPPDEREWVFEPFHARDAGTGRGGTGLGLAIARAVVQAHRGRMWIEGNPGGGTSMIIRLPAAGPRPRARVHVPGTSRGREP
jgi:two-component system sensor histidine kinase KdpD